jgi:hypothetical protein
MLALIKVKEGKSGEDKQKWPLNLVEEPTLPVFFWANEIFIF